MNNKSIKKIMKLILSLFFICVALSSAQQNSLNSEGPVYRNNAFSLPSQDFFCNSLGFVGIDFDVVDEEILKHFGSLDFQLVKYGLEVKRLGSSHDCGRLLRAGKNKLRVSIPFKELSEGKYDLYMGSATKVDVQYLCTIAVTVEPKSIGDALLKASHWDLKKYNTGLERYKKLFGTKWSHIQVPGVGSYVLDSVIGVGQDGQILKMVPADDEHEKPIILKVWRDNPEYNDATDTLKINNEINSRHIYTKECVVPLLYNKELKISGVRALVMPFVKGKTLAEILDSKELLPLKSYRRILEQFEAYKDLFESIEDFNSGNIIIEEGTEQLRLIDFAKGIRNQNDEGKRRTKALISAIEKKINAAEQKPA